jgi:hypothetical protein
MPSKPCALLLGLALAGCGTSGPVVCGAGTTLQGDTCVADSSTDLTPDSGSTPDAGNGDACANVACDMSPGTLCANDGTLRVYVAGGTCSGGKCSYDYEDMTCQFGCSHAACNGDPCANKACDTPPAAVCADSLTLRTYYTYDTVADRCSGGVCYYNPVDTTCPLGCENGACKKKCVAGDAADCTGPDMQWNGTQCCVAPHDVCTDGVKATCTANMGDWTGSQCCFDGPLSCVDGDANDCQPPVGVWTGAKCCVDSEAAQCISWTPAQCYNSNEHWTGSLCCP